MRHTAINTNRKTLLKWIHDPLTLSLTLKTPYQILQQDPLMNPSLTTFCCLYMAKHSDDLLPAMSDHYVVELKLSSTFSLQKRINSSHI